MRRSIDAGLKLVKRQGCLLAAFFSFTLLHAEQPPWVFVHPDGSLAFSSNPPRHSLGPISVDFHLPKSAPTKRGFEAQDLPAFTTQWETEGIRYVQTVIVAEPGEEAAPEAHRIACAVVLVRIYGENIAEEYTRATAAFSLASAGDPLELDLREDVIYAAGTDRVLAAINLPPGAQLQTEPKQLRFSGDMPPGNTGDMVLKIPALPLESESAINQLRDMDFNEELSRLKKTWRGKPSTAFPIGPAPRR